MLLLNNKLKLKVLNKNSKNISFIIITQPEILRSSGSQGVRVFYKEGTFSIKSNYYPVIDFHRNTFWLRGSHKKKDHSQLTCSKTLYKRICKGVKELNKKYASNLHLY